MYQFGDGQNPNQYEYHIKDHLGNTRIVVSQNGVELQQSAYYPFGMSFMQTNSGSDNKYLYNGKELQDDLLGNTQLDWYDYGARMYDPQIGRWHCPDPLNQFYSPYVYAANNPVVLIDPSGMFAFDHKDEPGDDAIRGIHPKTRNPWIPEPYIWKENPEYSKEAPRDNFINDPYGVKFYSESGGKKKKKETNVKDYNEVDLLKKSEYWAAALMRMKLGLPPDAISVALNIDIVGVAGGEIYIANFLLVLNGLDAGEYKCLFDFGLAVGYDVGISGTLTLYYYVGNVNNLKIGDFEGDRFSLSAGYSFWGFELGGGWMVASVDGKGYIIAKTSHVGASPSGPSGNINVCGKTLFIK